MEKFNQTKYINEYAKAHYKRYILELNKEKDKDIIEWLDNQPNKKQAIKEAIIEKMKKQ